MALEHVVAEIVQGLASLARALPAEGYIVHQLPSAPAYYLGYDAQGRTALLVPVTAHADQPAWPPVLLASLSFLPSVRSRLTELSGMTTEQDVSVILVDAAGTSFQPLLPSLLAGVIAAAGEAPRPGDLGRAVRGLRDVFRSLTREAKQSYLGTWGELFLMSTAHDVVKFAGAWGSDPTQTFDFAVEGERLEAKTTLQASRRHHFSYNQLLAAQTSEVVVASIQTATAPDGATASQLLDEVLSRLVTEPIVASVVLQRVSDALGSDLLRADAQAFDRQLAADSLALFPFAAVPAVELDPGVLDVSWTAQLPAIPDVAVATELTRALLGR